MSEFTRTQFDWLGLVADDANVPPNAFRLAFVISRHVNRESGEAWPSQDFLAAQMKMTPRAVRRLAEALRNAGYLHIVESHGRGHSNRYRMVVPSGAQRELSIEREAHENRTIESGISTEKEDNPVRFNDSETGQGSPVLAQENRTIESEKPDNSVQKTGPNCPINPYIEPLEEPYAPAPSDPAAAAAHDGPAELPDPTIPPTGKIVQLTEAAATPEADLYRRGREILGKSAGGMISNLVRAKGGSIALARAALETATTKHDAREYLGAIIRGREQRDGIDELRARGDAW